MYDLIINLDNEHLIISGVQNVSCKKILSCLFS